MKKRDDYYYQDYKEFDLREEAENYLMEKENRVWDKTDVVKLRIKS